MSLTVRLAGFNVDADLLGQTIELLRALKSKMDSMSANDLSTSDAREIFHLIQERLGGDIALEAFTPETISAAYARISRDPKHVTELRRAARFGVARARKSNENIIFGLGHASVAEHAAFNFDVSGLSRLAAEDLQSHRLLSFTEKSQRYITIGEDYVIPPEAMGTEVESSLREFVPLLFDGYARLYEALRTRYIPDGADELAKSELNLIEGRAKEDARYLLPLACTTQMGMTMNARNVEHIMADLSDHRLQELRELGEEIGKAVAGLAPSLVKYTTRGSYPRQNRKRIAEMLAGPGDSISGEIHDGPSAKIVEHTQDAEHRVLQAVAFSNGRGGWAHGSEMLTDEAKRGLWLELFRDMGEHDTALREFELARITFEAEVSASCFAQLKRHRMMTLLSQDYSLSGGAIIPPSVREAGLEGIFVEAVEASVKRAGLIRKQNPLLTAYLLTNAQRKRVLMQVNARELYHFARLRSDAHAQWEIRELSNQMIDAAALLWPNLLMLACGKDRFTDRYREKIVDRLIPENAR